MKFWDKYVSLAPGERPSLREGLTDVGFILAVPRLLPLNSQAFLRIQVSIPNRGPPTRTQDGFALATLIKGVHPAWKVEPRLTSMRCQNCWSHRAHHCQMGSAKEEYCQRDSARLIIAYTCCSSCGRERLLISIPETIDHAWQLCVMSVDSILADDIDSSERQRQQR